MRVGGGNPFHGLRKEFEARVLAVRFVAVVQGMERLNIRRFSRALFSSLIRLAQGLTSRNQIRRARLAQIKVEVGHGLSPVRDSALRVGSGHFPERTLRFVVPEGMHERDATVEVLLQLWVA